MTSPCPCHGFDPARARHELRRKSVSRRDILRWSLAGAGLTALGPWVGKIPVAKGAPAGNKIYVLVNLDGGCDTLNAVIPHTVQTYFDRRPTIAIPDASSLALTGGPNVSGYRLHPEFDRLRDMWNDGDVAIVHRVGYPNGNQSHFESQDIHSYGVRNGFPSLGIAQSGWVARYASLFAPTPMGAVSLGMGRPTSFVGGTSNPLQVSSLAGFRFNSDSSFTNNDTLRKNVIKQVLAGATNAGTPGDVRDAIDQAHQLSTQVQTAVSSFSSVATYGSRAFAQRMRDVAILVQAGFETRVFYAGTSFTGSFDTHSAQGAAAGDQANLFTIVDDALFALATDLKAMGQWENTVICLFTEFGRRNYENGSQGTDHGEGYEMILLGGGVNGGAYGPDITSNNLSGETLPYGVDFRDVHREVINDHLGGNAATVFPETQPLNTILGVA